jgi:hypothetical protein
MILHVYDCLGCKFLLLPIASLGSAFEVNNDRRLIRGLLAIVSDRTRHAAAAWALQRFVYGKGARERLRPCVTNKRPCICTGVRVIHENVGMSAEVGFFIEKNAKRILERKSIYEMLEE